MHYRVDELARAAGVGVDTIRFYQSRGLLPPPQRQGRVALYTAGHLERLLRIRALNRDGLRLEAVGRLLADEHGGDGEAIDAPGVRDSLLHALAQSEAAPEYTRAELETSAGVPAFLIAALEEVGLLAAEDGRYSAAARETLESARVLLDAGLPFAELLELAREHVAHVERIAGRAIDLFEAQLRERERAGPGTPLAAADTFRRLLPAVTRLVAVHFERVLVSRARARLEEPQP